MRKSRSPRRFSNYVQITARKILSAKLRNRLVAFFVLIALASTVLFSLTSHAQRVRNGASDTAQDNTSAQRKSESAQNNGASNPLSNLSAMVQVANNQVKVNRSPKESRLNRAREFNGDLRQLPNKKPVKKERPEREPPERMPRVFGAPTGDTAGAAAPVGSGLPVGAPAAPAPTPSNNFAGLDFANWGAGHPPDTNGDVGPTYYIQTVNTSIGIYNKSTGVRVAAFTFDTFMSQGNFGNLCDTDNFGDPVVVYDSFEDRWIITDFAFQLDASDNVINPPGSFQCIAASKTGDPVSGGWNFYSINTTGGLGDYPKFGIWPDGLYMSTNMFDYSATGNFQNVRVYAFNKAQMYAGVPSVQVVSFDAPSDEFTLLPSNARLQAGTPPNGTPNYFSSLGNYLNAVTFYKFHVDWNSISTSTFTGPFLTIAPASWAYTTSIDNVPTNGGNNIDTLAPRTMMQNQYSNIGGVESLWNAHTVQGSSTTQAAVRYYQVTVTGGTIAANTTQAATHNPDTTNRFMPSLAVDRLGDMALGYSTSSSTLFPAIKYAGRLSTDAVNTLPQTETSLINGTGTQTGTCGGTCTRWGDYSAMTLDPDGCTFWYTNEYYATSGLNDLTRIGSFRFGTCTTVGNGTLSGTVTATTGGAPISGATVALGSRTTTTNGSGVYTFTGLPAGTYPSVTASAAGYTSSTANSIVVTTGATTTRNFSLGTAVSSACLTDTSQTDFQTGVPTNTDLTSSPGNVILLDAPAIDQQNLDDPSGTTFTSTSWAGQTFTPSVSGQLQKVEVDLFCSSCTGTAPNITVSIRATSSNLPTGSDLATATIPGNASGSGGFYTATFGSPPALTAGTQYSIVMRPVTNPSAGAYAYGVSTANPYAGGRLVTSTNSGGTWTGTNTRDIGFKTTMKQGFASSGDFVSGLKDANPAIGATASWSTLSWSAGTPVGTTLKLQAAASNNAFGPFNFVGPDGTATSFFNNPGSLSQFNGFRYLKYKVFMTTTSSSVTPTLNDVTVCFSNVLPTVLTVSPATGPYNGFADFTATLTSGGNPVSGKTITFTRNGAGFGGNTAVTNASGVATRVGVSITGLTPGSYPNYVGASFAGDSGYTGSSGSNTLTVIKANQTITFDALGDKTYGDPDFNVGATASSGLSVSFGATGNCTVTGNSVHITGAGSCTITASQTGDSNYNAAPDVARTFSIVKSNQTITFDALGDKTYGDPDFNVGATASSGLSVSFGASGQCTVTGNLVHITGAGSCTITASQAGDSNYNAALDVNQPFSIAKANQTITFDPLPVKTFGDPDFNVNATASTGFTVSFSAAGNCTVTGNTVHLTSGGSCTITASQAGDSNYNAAPNVDQSFSISEASTMTDISSNNNPSAGSEPVTFTATVTSPAGTPTGTVTFKDGGNILGAGTLISGHATYTTSSLSEGDHSITADYAGSAGNYDLSTSSALTQTVHTALSTCVNVAAASYGASASASSEAGAGYAASGAIDGNHTGAGWGTGVGWNDSTAGAYPDSLMVNLGVSQSLNEIDVYSLQDNYGNPAEPTESMTFMQYGLTDFQVQVPDGMGGWQDVPGGHIINNNSVRNRIMFNSPVTTDQIRIVVNTSPDGVYSRVVEVEAFSCSATPVPTPTPTPSPTPQACATNVAASSYGATASASSEAGAGYAAAGAIDGNHIGAGWGTGVGWNDATAGAYPDDVTVNLGVTQSISEIDVYSLQDNYTSPVEPTDTMTFSAYGLTDFQVQRSTGTGWVDVPGGHVTGNNLVKRRITFGTPISTDMIRVIVNSSADGVYSRVVEVEAFSCNAQVVPAPTPTPTPTPQACATNVAASSYGATASASSEAGAGYAASGVIDGNHVGNGWGTGVGWNDGTPGVYPDNLVVNLGVTQSISEIDVYSLQDNYTSPVEPTDTMTFSAYGLTDFQVQVPDGLGGWIDAPGGHITGNNLVKRKVIFATPVSTSQIRILVNSSADGVYSRVVEVEAFSCNPVTVTRQSVKGTANRSAQELGALSAPATGTDGGWMRSLFFKPLAKMKTTLFGNGQRGSVSALAFAPPMTMPQPGQ